MAKVVKMILAALVTVPLLSGCVYYNVTSPLDTDLDETELGSKVGRSQAQSVLWLVGWGDAGTQAAAKDGGVTTIRHADQTLFLVLLGLYAQQTTIVYGD